ncbi:MAG: AAA family ATPase [Prevotella sp.]|nr:AAA family ATPase [Prevotella sp.]MBO4658617.1 AAA family ATPase [Prevotella sp.]
MERNEQLRIAWNFVENTGKTIFLTGKAGTGKTTFLKTVVERSKKRSIVVAPTGVAAINAGGMTIHSFFQLPLSPYVPNTTYKAKYDFSRDKRRIIASIDLLIIDEISMVRGDLLDAVDNVLRRYHNHFLPFGGVQLLMIGDLQQLTPVVTPADEQLLKPYYDTPYFFSSKALAQTDYVTIQLDKVYRQQDEAFIDILNHIREGQASDEDLACLNTRCHPHFTPKAEEAYIRLTTHNRLADQHNDRELERLATPSHVYNAEVEGVFPSTSYPTSERLVLKTGTQVMFVKNDPSGNRLYYNGKIGRVVGLNATTVTVECPEDDSAIEVEPLEWENTRYTLNAETQEIETKVEGVFRQFPLRLAWAITIHKSQGLTFDRAIIDASMSFAPGQVYVALSRCRTLEGMVLSSPIPRSAILSDHRVDSYIAHQETHARESITRLPQLKEEYYRHLLTELFDFGELVVHQEHLVRVFVEYFSHSHPQLEQLQKQTLEGLRKEVVDIAGRWVATIRQSTMETLHSETFLQRVSRGAEYFDQHLDQLFEKPLRMSGEVKSNNKQAMKRLGNILSDLRQCYDARQTLLHQMAIKGFTIQNYLREKQLAMLGSMATEEESGRSKKERRQGKAKERKAPKEKSWAVTLRMRKAGMLPEEIAVERCLAMTTIIGHLIHCLDDGEVTLDEVISPERQQAIRRAIIAVGRNGAFGEIKALCPPGTTYDEIRLMKEKMEND